MQDDKKYLDRYVAESLKGFREKPSSHAWKRLEEDLLRARRHRRLVLYRWTAAAAVLLIALITGYLTTTFRQDRPLKESTLTQSEKPSAIQDTKDQAVTKEASLSATADTPPVEISVAAKETIQPTRERKDQSLPPAPAATGISQEEIAQVTQQEAIPDIPPPVSEENEFVEPIPEKQELKPIEHPDQKPVLSETLPDLIQTEDVIQKGSNTRWSVGGSFAPVYAYRTIRIDAKELPPDVNPDKNYYDNAEDAMYSYSGGLDVVYRMQDKWEFQTGLYLSNLGHTNEEVIAYETEGVKDLLKVSSSTGIIDIKTTKLPASFIDNSVRRDSVTDAVYINSSIHQSFTYLELPLLIRYAVLDKRLGIHLTGGFSPGIMTDYQARFTYEGNNIDLDNEGDFYTLIYNSQVGLGINYHLTKSLTINLDPAFKYSLNSIRKDHSIEYHPYSISIFTGIRFSF